MTAPEQPVEVVHACPPGDEGITPCCGVTPFELPPWASRITTDPALVTCTGGLVPNTGQARETGADWAARPQRFSPEDTLSVAERLGAAEPSVDTVQAPDVAATALRDAARLLDMVADARDVYLEGMEEDSESAVAIETFGSGIRSAARILRAEPHTVELLVPTWRYLGELAELDLRVRALLATDTGQASH